MEWHTVAGDMVRVFDTVGVDAELSEFVDVTDVMDDGRFVRPPQEIRDRFEEGDVVFWLWWSGASGAYWNLMDEDAVIEMMNPTEVEDR